jgi:hypothetical protein
MLNENDESAFPVQVGNTIDDLRGMSLLDWFAGQALAGVWAGRESDFARIQQPTATDVAKASYLIAEAMMNERKRRNDERK